MVGSNADWKEDVKKILTENLINGEQKAIAVSNTQLEYIKFFEKLTDLLILKMLWDRNLSRNLRLSRGIIDQHRD